MLFPVYLFFLLMPMLYAIRAPWWLCLAVIGFALTCLEVLHG